MHRSDVVLVAHDHVHHLVEVLLALRYRCEQMRKQLQGKGQDERERRRGRRGEAGPTLISSSSAGNWYSGCMVLRRRPWTSRKSVSAISGVTGYV